MSEKWKKLRQFFRRATVAPTAETLPDAAQANRIALRVRPPRCGCGQLATYIALRSVFGADHFQVSGELVGKHSYEGYALCVQCCIQPNVSAQRQAQDRLQRQFNMQAQEQ